MQANVKDIAGPKQYFHETIVLDLLMQQKVKNFVCPRVLLQLDVPHTHL